MRIVSYQIAGTPSFGIVSGDGIVDCGYRLGFPNLRAALDQLGMDAFRPFVEEAPDHRLSDVMLLPPITDPRKIFCIGVNYATHLAESGHPTPQHPMVFMRVANSQVGAGEALLRPLESERFDFEGELAVVIGRPCRRVPRSEALSHVFGYSCYNDGSVRDWQRHTSQFGPGKNFYRTGGFGPWIVTADEIPDPSRLTLVARLNGQEMQRALTSDLVFDVPALIAYCSTFTARRPARSRQERARGG